MLAFLITMILIAIVLIVPIKMAATNVGAQNTGVFMCFIALIFAAAIQAGVSALVPQLAQIHVLVNIAVSLLLSGFAYMLVLGTSYGKGIIIAIIQTLLTLLLGFIAGLLGLGIAMSL